MENKRKSTFDKDFMIKKYIQFIKENEINGFDSFGEWVESLSNDDYIYNIITRYIKDIDVSIDISNVINILDKQIQDEIKIQIDNYLENGIENKDPELIVSTDLEPLTESEISVAGKGMFVSFLKVLTGLGQKENSPNWEKCPSNFLIYYIFSNINSDVTKQLFNRFKSLTRYIDMIDYQKNELDLYFGIKTDGQFEYGLYYDKHLPIGQFKLSSGVIKWICQSESKSAHSLKKILVNLRYDDILTFGKIKIDMDTYNPGYYEKKLVPKIEDKVISFGYYGIGKWNSGKLDDIEYNSIKNNFTTWILSKKWGGKVLVNVKPLSFWVYLNLKLK